MTYKVLDNGVIKQDGFFNSKIAYDQQYIEERYDTYDTGDVMAYLRLGMLSQVKRTGKIIDVGYGNGDFLKACSGIFKDCVGYDVTGYKLPDCARFQHPSKERWDVITMFDVLEHLEDIYEIKSWETDYFLITIPLCPTTNPDTEEFMNWKHRRPDEHLWHFTIESLDNFMEEIDCFRMSGCHLEDSIRGNLNGKPNTFTGLYFKG